MTVPGKVEAWMKFFTGLKHEDFLPYKLSETSVVFIAERSLGVFMINNNPESGNPISLFVDLIPQDDKVTLKFYTRFREDWYLSLGISGFIILITILAPTNHEVLYVAVGLALLIPVWIWATHRWQERTLLDIVKKKIKTCYNNG